MTATVKKTRHAHVTLSTKISNALYPPTTSLLLNQAFGSAGLVPCPPRVFLLTSLNPPTNMINASNPRITAKVTTAPITPPTAVEIPWLLPEFELEEEDPDELLELELAYAAQVPVTFPQVLHHSSVVLIANWLVLEANVVHGMDVSKPPKSG